VRSLRRRCCALSAASRRVPCAKDTPTPFKIDTGKTVPGGTPLCSGWDPQLGIHDNLPIRRVM
jgi:hypothetical protein